MTTNLRKWCKNLKIIYNVTFLHRKWNSPRKLIPAQGKVFPRAVFNPPRVGLYIPSEAVTSKVKSKVKSFSDLGWYFLSF